MAWWQDRSNPLSVPAFRRVLFANVVNFFGSAVAPLALAFAVLDHAGGTGSLAIVLALNSLPSIVFYLYGGVLADRISRTFLLASSRIASGIVQALTAAVVLAGVATTANLAVLGVLAGAAQAISRPATDAIVRQVVAPDLLQTAFAYNRLSRNGIKIIGPVLGGVLVAATNPGWALVLDAVSFFVCAAIMAGLRLPAVRDAGGSSLRRDLAIGWREFTARRWLWFFTVCGTVIITAWTSGYLLLGPVVAKASYQGASTWGVVQGAYAAGMVIGAMVAIRLRPGRPLLAAVGFSGAMAWPLLAMGATLPVWLLVGGMVLAGICNDIAMVFWSLVLGTELDIEMQGRLMSINMVGEQFAMPIGFLVVGALSGAIDPHHIQFGCGVICVLVTIINMGEPQTIRMRRKEPQGSN